MFDNNILKFKHGWNQNPGPIENHKEVREIQQQVTAKGIVSDIKAEPSHLIP